ncbi:MAG: energy transducer TonB [Acidobacteriota bacterium]|nr:energy transducer TonB [Acidobacteriota bacterium]
MLRLTSIVIFCFVVLAGAAFAQDAQTISSEKQIGEWHKLKSANLEFSFEMPAGYSYFFDAGGFVASENSNSYFMKEMQLINNYHDRTLMSVEIYRTTQRKSAIDAMLDFQNLRADAEKLNIPDFVGREFNARGDDWTRTTRYIASKTHLYIISAATREKNNSTFQRFLSSVRFNDNTDSAANTILISSLKSVEPEVSFENPKDNKAAAAKSPSGTQTPEPDVTKLAVIGTPRVSYTNQARQEGTTGTLRLRLTFSPSGSVSKIAVLQELPGGLMRQAALNALRFKFLPQEKGGKPVSVSKVVEFRFSMY